VNVFDGLACTSCVDTGSALLATAQGITRRHVRERVMQVHAGRHPLLFKRHRDA